MRVFLVCALMAAATVFGMAAGCNDSGVGRKCLYTGSADGGLPGGTTISSPSLECMSRLCYLQAGSADKPGDRTYCTAKCTSTEDCQGGLIGDTAGLCRSRFVCAIPTSVGSFACQQLCVCEDDLVAGFNTDSVDGGVVCPPACNTQGKCPTGK